MQRLELYDRANHRFVSSSVSKTPFLMNAYLFILIIPSTSISWDGPSYPLVGPKGVDSNLIKGAAPFSMKKIINMQQPHASSSIYDQLDLMSVSIYVEYCGLKIC